MTLSQKFTFNKETKMYICTRKNFKFVLYFRIFAIDIFVFVAVIMYFKPELTSRTLKTETSTLVTKTTEQNVDTEHCSLQFVDNTEYVSSVTSFIQRVSKKPVRVLYSAVHECYIPSTK